jgi:hypothetical protein
MAGTLAEVDARELSDAPDFRREVIEHCQPVVVRGLVSSWPVVRAGVQSAQDLQSYLALYDSGRQTEAFIGDPRIAGKYYYGEGLSGFNFERRPLGFGEAVRMMVATAGQAGAPTMYVGSIPIEEYLPGFATANALPVLPPFIAPRIWLGHASNVSAHFDTVDNLACVVAGSRRFTLYPPEAIAGLYVGPIDHTMAGQPVSLAASGPRDDVRYPLFAPIRDLALIADLRPGDAIYIPKLWWHQVEATAPFNGLVNYWWDAFAAGRDSPYTGLLLSMMAIADRPAAERQAWKAFFDHYVFRSSGHPLAHLPVEQHGMLGALTPANYAAIRAVVMHRLRGNG